MSEQDSADQPSWRRWLPEEISRSMIAAFCAALVGVGAAYLGLAQLGTSTTPNTSGRPTSLAGEIASRHFWQQTPDTYPVGDLSSNGPARAVTDKGDVMAFSPRQLWENGASILGSPVYLVGKVVDSQILTPRFLPSQEIELRGYSAGFEAYLAISPGGPLNAIQPGNVLFAVGYLAAKGMATALDGRITRTVYIVAPRTGDAGLSSVAPPDGAIARLADGLERRLPS